MYRLCPGFIYVILFLKHFKILIHPVHEKIVCFQREFTYVLGHSHTNSHTLQESGSSLQDRTSACFNKS